MEALTEDCFDPDGVLELAFKEAEERGWTDEQLLDLIEELIQNDILHTPWCFKVKDSPFAGDYWIISGPEAKERIPEGDFALTLDELRPIVEACRVLEGRVMQAHRAIKKEGVCPKTNSSPLIRLS